MNLRRLRFGQSLIIAGTGVLGIGVLLILIRLVMLIAWYAAGVVVLAGGVLLLIGFLLKRI